MSKNLKSLLLVCSVVAVSACEEIKDYPTGYGAHSGVTHSAEQNVAYDGRTAGGADGIYDDINMDDGDVMNMQDFDGNFQKEQRKSVF